MRRLLTLPALGLVLLSGCKDGTGPVDPPGAVRLEVGQVFTGAGEQAGLLNVLGSQGAEYLLVSFFGTETNTATLPLEIAAQGTAAVVGPPRPSMIPQSLLSLGASAVQAANGNESGFHQRLREYESQMLAARRQMAPATPNFSRSAAAVPQVGDVIPINTGNSTTELCSAFTGRSGRVEAVSQWAIVVADVTNPAGGFTRAEYQSFATAFDELVYPVNVENFGTPGDLDQNQRSIIFFTRGVNELTPAGSKFVIGGYFFSGDFLTPQQCLASNRGEYFYMLVPDPTGAVNGNVRSKEALLRSTVSTLGHEFQHLINASYRFANNAPGEEVWLNEGLSHIAEELLFYRTSGLAPRQNIDINRLRGSAGAIDAVNTYQLENIFRYIEYLENPEANSPYQRSDSLAVRGAAWSFLRYAADRRNGTDAQLWRQLVASRTSGLQNLKDALGSETIPMIRDWTTSVYTDDAVAGIDARYTQPSWNFRSVLAALTSGGNPLFPQYPLVVRPLSDATPLSVTLKNRGAAAFLRFGLGPNGQAEIRTTTAGGGALPANAFVSVVRTK